MKYHMSSRIQHSNIFFLSMNLYRKSVHFLISQRFPDKKLVQNKSQLYLYCSRLNIVSPTLLLRRSAAHRPPSTICFLGARTRSRLVLPFILSANILTLSFTWANFIHLRAVRHCLVLCIVYFRYAIRTRSSIFRFEYRMSG